MSEGVRFTKEGLKCFEWNPDIKQYEEEKPPKTFLSKLRTACSIDKGVTLGDIFDAVEKDEFLKFVIGEYSWCNVDTFHKEAKKPVVKKANLDYLELHKYYEVGEGEITGFNGVGQGVDNWSVSFTPVNEMVDIEVRLDVNCRVLKDHEEIANEPTHFSLLEVLDTIYFDISFYGGPEDRDEKHFELHEMVEKIQSGEAKTRPLELKKDTIQ